MLARLRNVARASGRDFNAVLRQYVLERALDRVGRSPYRERFVLKGALTFLVGARGEMVGRPTKDADLEALRFAPQPEVLAGVFREILALPSDPDDAVVFDLATLTAERIREGQAYEGVRVRVDARIGRLRDRAQLDVAFGNDVTPAPFEADLPRLLPDMSAPHLLVYPDASVVSEKFEAMVSLGDVNTRVKDFGDLYVLASTKAFDGAVLGEAMRRTFARRGTPLRPDAAVFAEAYARDAQRVRDWAAFRRRSRPAEYPEDFANVHALVVCFVRPPYAALCAREPFHAAWDPAAGEWRPEGSG